MTRRAIDLPLRTRDRAVADVAVVVGLEDYAFVQDVPYARRDAQAVADWLVYTRGVPLDRVQLLTQGSREHVLEAVERAGRQAADGGIVWVYFAGHGAADPATRERLLLGDDVRADATGFATRGVLVGEVERLAAAGGGRPVLLLDTCFGGVGRDGTDLVAGARFAVPSWTVAAQGDGVQWTASGPNELSGPLDAAQHGAFTYFVVGALRGWADGEITGVRDGAVTGEEAHAFVSRMLRAAQKRDQEPMWAGPIDFTFIRGVVEELKIEPGADAPVPDVSVPTEPPEADRARSARKERRAEEQSSPSFAFGDLHPEDFDFVVEPLGGTLPHDVIWSEIEQKALPTLLGCYRAAVAIDRGATMDLRVSVVLGEDGRVRTSRGAAACASVSISNAAATREAELALARCYWANPGGGLCATPFPPLDPDNATLDPVWKTRSVRTAFRVHLDPENGGTLRPLRAP